MSILRLLDWKQTNCLLRAAKLQLLLPGETLFRQLEVDSALYLILNGRVAIEFDYISHLHPPEEGQVAPSLHMNHRGQEIWGIFGFFEGNYQSETCRALEMTEVLRIDRTKVHKIVVTMHRQRDHHEELVDIKYFKDTCKNPYIPRENFDHCSQLRLVQRIQ